MTDKTDVTAPLREAFAQRTDTSPDDWFCTFKARYGMREAFSAVRDVAGDGLVVTTLFTGCTAVDSILAAGMGVGYADISDATLSVDAARLEVGPEVRAVLLQNSYGMVDEAVTRAIADKAHAAGAILVEDSAHCLSRMARDADGRPVADVSVHSFGIEKTFSDIYFGGALWVNPAMADAALHDAIVARLRSCAELPARLGRACASYRTHARILAHLPGALSGVAKSVLLHTGSYEPPVADVERRGGLPYPSYLPNEWVVQRILPRFATLDEDEERRREASFAYAELLGDEFSGRIPAAALNACKGQPLLRFPILLDDKAQADEAAARLLAHGHYAVHWYFRPFFPGALDLGAYGLSDGDARLADYDARFSGVLGLPTERGAEAAREAAGIVGDLLRA